MPEKFTSSDITVLGFDWGKKRIGTAVGNSITRSATALRTLRGDRNDLKFDAIAALIREWQPQQLVVGLPLHPDGAAHDNTAHARRFARQLEGRYRLPVALQDERFTSAEADAQLRDGGQKDWRERKKQLDAHAAQLILKDYFDVTA